MGEDFDMRFFCPLLPGFSKKLLIPQELAKDTRFDKNRNIATIVSSHGKVFHVDIYTETDNTFIGGKGWEIFVKALCLRDWDLLILRYRENMRFTVRVFDKLTRCEKKYPNGSPNNVKDNIIISDQDDGDENSDDIEIPTKSSSKKRKAQDLTHISISEDSTEAYSQDQVQENIQFSESREDHCSSKEITNARFEGTITSEYHRMHVPAVFKEAAGLDKVSDVTLVEPNGRRCSVDVSHNRNGSYVKTFLTGRWKQFFVSNNLQNGDKCFFELQPEENNEKVIKVEIFKKYLSKAAGKGKTIISEVDDDEKSNTIRKPTKSQNFASAHFETTITADFFTHRRLYIPKEFKQATHLQELSKVILIDPNGRNWPIRLTGTSHLRGDLPQFAATNNVQVGDKCIFESNHGENVLRVRIVKKKKGTPKKSK